MRLICGECQKFEIDTGVSCSYCGCPSASHAKLTATKSTQTSEGSSKGHQFNESQICGKTKVSTGFQSQRVNTINSYLIRFYHPFWENCPYMGSFHQKFIQIPKYGSRFVLLTGMSVCGGSLILFGFCGKISDQTLFVVLCFLLRATAAIGSAASETSAMSIIIEQFPNNVATLIGASETFCGIGLSLGPALGGILYTAGGFKLPFIVIASAMITAMVPLALILEKDNESKSNEESADEESPSIFEALRIPAIFVLALSFVITGFGFAFMEPIFAPHFKKLGQSPTQIGLMFFLFCGVYALLAPVVGCIGDKTKCFRGMGIFGFATFGLGYLLLGPTPVLTFLPSNVVWLAYIALSVCGLGAGFAFVPIMPDLIRTARVNGMPDNSSTNGVLSSIFPTMYYLGVTIGPTLAGICDEHLGFEWATSIAGFFIFGHVMLLSLFTLYERVFQRDNIDSNFVEEEIKPLVHDNEKSQQTHP